MKTVPALALALLLIGTATPSLAHGTAAAWYGGQTTETAEGWRVEFAIRDGGVRAWVRDHDDKPVAASGKVVLLVGGKKVEAALKADGEALSADIAVNAADKVTAILSLSVGGKPSSARFAQEAVTIPALNPQAAAGKQTFDRVCATCHGPALRGSDAAPPLLHPLYAPGSGHGDDVVLAAIRTGAKSHMWKFGDMPKPEGVKSGQETDILAYIRSIQAANGLGNAPAITDPAAPRPHAGHH
ncbi:hypothetical protein A6A04_10405 [Paramagnetospirillum marisnigri]|uniref:Cytochrome c domain-containing protein n=1 Tax=Paramagnetospirillum marisnigri TaxID=1285242 RepID=A0A178MXX4_9PROT|nr:c-type cytochrome [Paramagnetospirillum marisnigri]OAN55965.1 hypothetical protein A6A04_10405 [Paramagnetospirillum marisnigri]